MRATAANWLSHLWASQNTPFGSQGTELWEVLLSTSTSSLSKSSKFLTRFLVKCCIQFSKFCQRHICLIFFKFPLCTTNVHINYDFILPKSLNSPNLYISSANTWYPDYQNKKLNWCMLISFKGFHLCIKWAIMWYLDNQLRKKLNLRMLLQAIKTSFARIKQEYKICINNLSMNNYIYLLRQQ